MSKQNHLIYVQTLPPLFDRVDKLLLGKLSLLLKLGSAAATEAEQVEGVQCARSAQSFDVLRLNNRSLCLENHSQDQICVQKQN